MKSILKMLDKATNSIWNAIMIITCVAVTALIMIAALMRYILKIDFYGSEEIILYVAFWLYFIGSISSSRDNTHINANMISLFTHNPKIIRTIEACKTVFCLMIGLLALKWSFDYICWTFATGGRSSVFKMPTIIAQFPIFLSYAFWVIYLIRDVVLLFMPDRKEDEI